MKRNFQEPLSREQREKLSKILYQEILPKANYCPKQAEEIIIKEYFHEPWKMFSLLKLLHRWNESQKLERVGGRNYYNLWKWMEENR